MNADQIMTWLFWTIVVVLVAVGIYMLATGQSLAGPDDRVSQILIGGVGR